MSKRPRPDLDGVDLQNLAGACFATSADHLRDAWVLLSAGRVPGAAFHTVMSLEETLKARYCELAGTEDSDAFWDGFVQHKAKLSKAGEYLGEEVPKNLASVLIDLRERCLYASVSPDGRPLTPRGLVDPGGLSAATVGSWIVWLQGVNQRLLRAGAAPTTPWQPSKAVP